MEERLAALEAEVKAQRDHLEIQQLISSYGPVVDTADGPERAKKVAALWAEDGSYDIGGMHFCQGHDEIAAVFAERHFEQVKDGICHVMGLPYIRVDGDQAIALNYSTVFRPEGENFYPWRVAANRWDLVRIAGKWRVKTRVNRLMNGDMPARDMLRIIDQMVA
jgi:hypothetical protein